MAINIGNSVGPGALGRSGPTRPHGKRCGTIVGMVSRNRERLRRERIDPRSARRSEGPCRLGGESGNQPAYSKSSTWTTGLPISGNTPSGSPCPTEVPPFHLGIDVRPSTWLRARVEPKTPAMRVGCSPLALDRIQECDSRTRRFPKRGPYLSIICRLGSVEPSQKIYNV